MSADDSAPGWEAIDAALRPLYADQEPLHWAPTIHAALGGPDPLDGISAYSRLEPFPHWHFITYGFSDLYVKEGPDADISGFGFELTFRLRRETSETQPPSWPLSLLQNLARYVFSSGNTFDAGHYMSLNSAIALGYETQLRAVLFVRDPELGDIATPHGRLSFLQVVGITLPELSSVRAWDAEKFSAAILPRLPLWITDLGRSSLTDDAPFASMLREGTQRDGSSTAFLYVGAVAWKPQRRLLRQRLLLSFGANGVRDLRVVLPGRLPHNRPLVVASGAHTVTLEPGDSCTWQVTGPTDVTVRLTRAAAEELAQVLVPVRGTYRLSTFPDLDLLVVPSEIKDSKGNVVEVIG